MRMRADGASLSAMEILDGPDAGSLGLASATLRRRHARGALERIRPGSYATPLERTPEERHDLLLRATVPRLGPGTVVSHTSAARLHGLPVLRSRLDLVTVTRPRSNGERSKQLHARRAQVDGSETVVLGGMIATSLPRTVADLARTLPFDEAVACADVALALGMDRKSPPRLGRKASAIAAVLDFADPASESIGESLSRVALAGAGMPTPSLQHEIRTSSGRFVARTDFAWPRHKVVGEFDGAAKYAAELDDDRAPEQRLMDEKRREWAIRDLGWEVVRWDWQTLRTPGALAERVRGALLRAERARAS